MSGGFQVQEEAIQAAINHLQALLTEADANTPKLRFGEWLRPPGASPVTTHFHQAAMDSSAHLSQQHDQLIQQVRNQITQLQQQLQQYRAGEDAAAGGFRNGGS